LQSVHKKFIPLFLIISLLRRTNNTSQVTPGKLPGNALSEKVAYIVLVYFSCDPYIPTFAHHYQ